MPDEAFPELLRQHVANVRAFARDWERDRLGREPTKPEIDSRRRLLQRWLEGSVTPKPASVARAERALGLSPGTLERTIPRPRKRASLRAEVEELQRVVREIQARLAEATSP